MRLQRFEIEKIGPMYRHMPSPFARACVSISVRDENSEAINTISLDVVTAYGNSEAMERVRSGVLSETLRTLRAAVAVLEGRNIQALHAMVDADRKDLDELQRQRWDLGEPVAGE